MKEKIRIKKIEQIKVMAHSLRLRLLEAFSHEPATTKQVAEEIGEPPTKLYHHVNMLKRAGLIELVKTKKKRGTTEKYYRTVADQFVVDGNIFKIKSTGKETLSRMQKVTKEILKNAMAEMRESLEERLNKEKDKRRKFILSHTHIRATEEQIIKLAKQINELVKKHESKRGKKGAKRYGVIVSLYQTGNKSGISKRRKR